MRTEGIKCDSCGKKWSHFDSPMSWLFVTVGNLGIKFPPKDGNFRLRRQLADRKIDFCCMPCFVSWIQGIVEGEIE